MQFRKFDIYDEARKEFLYPGNVRDMGEEFNEETINIQTVIGRCIFVTSILTFHVFKR